MTIANVIAKQGVPKQLIVLTEKDLANAITLEESLLMSHNLLHDLKGKLSTLSALVWGMSSNLERGEPITEHMSVSQKASDEAVQICFDIQKIEEKLLQCLHINKPEEDPT